MSNKFSRIVGTIFIFFSLTFLVGCSISSTGAENSDTSVSQLVGELNQLLIPLDGSPLDLPDTNLEFLTSYSGTRILGLGEATHGTTEFFTMKHRIFRYLVERYAYRAIAFEADFAESIYLDRYLHNGKGDLDASMKAVMHFWTWKTEEVEDLLEWMKNYNSGRPEDQHLYYFGIDCQATTFQPGLLQTYFLKTLPMIWQRWSSLILDIRDMTPQDYRALSPSKFKEMYSQLDNLTASMVSNKELLTSASSQREYRLIKHVLRTFVQAFTVQYRFETGNGDFSRDRYMAENALWVADYLEEDAKIVLWAHNGHIAKDPDYLVTGSMGHLLAETLGQEYTGIGFAFSTGGFNAMGEDDNSRYTGVAPQSIEVEPWESSVNYLWKQASHNIFVFQPDVFGKGTAWYRWLSSPKPFLMIGATYNGFPDFYYRITDIRTHYDAIIYFDIVSPTRLLAE